MSNRACLSWFDFINERKVEAVFFLNRYLNNWHVSKKIGNYSSLLLSSRWNISRWEIDPEFLKSPFEEKEPNYLLVYASKKASADATEDALSSESHLNLAKQSFFVQEYLTYSPKCTGQYHRELYKGMGGPFYHFWQALKK